MDSLEASDAVLGIDVDVYEVEMDTQDTDVKR